MFKVICYFPKNSTSMSFFDENTAYEYAADYIQSNLSVKVIEVADPSDKVKFRFRRCSPTLTIASAVASPAFNS